ncbi:hypothetical protein F5Y14DRAFT_414457 [Nemania sp. NC0429]|nr:hypothetical protein F5Y14DRAFT_414457 [Nemania sp. NC0429]
MPFRPYSLGCHSCRRMKVKCDEEKPQCRRCVKARRVCPGYRNTKQLIFRSMNAELASRAGASRSSQAHASITPPGDTASTGPITSVLFTPRALSQSSGEWDAKAISFFLHNHSFAPTKDGPGHLGSLPDLLGSRVNGKGYLESAVLAAGSATLANITGLTHLGRIAERYYGETLRSLSATLGDPVEASSDVTLATIIVLQKYEAIVGITIAASDPHDKGLVQLLRLRGKARRGTDIENDLLRIVHGRLHTNSVGGLFPSQIEAGYDVDVDVVEIPAYQYELWRLIRETSQCCAEARGVMSGSCKGVFKSEFLQSLDNVLSAYLGLLDWQANPPSSLIYQSWKVPGQGVDGLQPGNFPEKYYLFKNILQGETWIHFWCALIYALQTLVQISSLPLVQQLLGRDWDETWRFTRRLHDAVDEICACVPYMMGDVDQSGLPTIGKDGKALGSFFLLRGLYVASCVEEMSSEQREYIMRTLLRIAHLKGIKLALRPRSRLLSQHNCAESGC